MSKLVESARALIGTPFKHQGRLPGIGIDCIGLLVIAGRNAGAVISDVRTYSRHPNPHQLLRHLREQLDPVGLNELLPGDIVVMAYQRGLPQHVGMITDVGIIHTDLTVGFVSEHVIDQQVRDRFVSGWRFRW